MFKKLFGSFFDSNEKAIKNVQPILKLIKEKEISASKLNDKQIVEKVQDIKRSLEKFVDAIPDEARSSLQTQSETSQKYQKKENDLKNELYNLIPEFFPLINEVYKRKVGISYFDVQYIAGIILSQGHKLTELKTGEGKTMVFQLPAFLYALAGRGSHVVTVNDYLARVGGEYAGHIAHELGLTVGVITPESSYRFIPDEMVEKLKGEDVYKEAQEHYKTNGGLKISNMRGYNLIECDKKESYASDIVYGTNNEFGFDYLRDNMARDLGSIKQSELYFCIIDEADSILIDEARTPLIISAPAEISNELYQKFAGIVKRLKIEEDYTVDEKARSAVLTEIGIEKMEKFLNVKNIWEDYQLAHHLENALKAQSLFKKDIDYLVRDGEVLIVDQFTGRVLSGRRYSEGLHQAIEAKEGVEIKKESKTLATITFQNFFRLYKIISGGSGTIMTEAEEFFRIYKLDSVEIPTNKPVIRKDENDRVYKNRKAKFDAVAKEIKEAHATGQPILVGTTSIEDSEYISKLVDKMGIEHEVLNAKHHEKEAMIVSKAGRKGAVTIATNMAGRGTDIPLENGVTKVGGLYVLGTQRHESRRIDNQLRGRSGRQGDPGRSRFFISLDDDIMRIQGGQIVQKIMEMTNIPDDMPIEAGLIGRSIETAQKKMENMHFDSRKRVVEYDDVMNQQREIYYVRRRSILEKTENSLGYFLNYPALSKKDLSDITVQNAQEDIRQLIQDQLIEEVETIVANHFFDDRDDKIDLKKLIENFLDLAPDTLITKAIENLRKGKDQKSNQITLHIYDELKDKPKEYIIEYLSNIIREVHKIQQEELGLDYYEVVKIVSLETMDNLWTSHLETMEDLREGIGLRGYAQRDPLVEYKNEGFNQFEIFINGINSQINRRILKVTKKLSTQSQPTIRMRTNDSEISDILEGTREMLQSISNVMDAKQATSKNEKEKTFVSSAKTKLGRNDPCWCGSGKKFKKCHGR